jgi:ABC-type multidrug transport system ATPase subunit
LCDFRDEAGVEPRVLAQHDPQVIGRGNAIAARERNLRGMELFLRLTAPERECTLGLTRRLVELPDTLTMLDIHHLAERAPYQLSGGQKKRVAIGSVLVMNPDVLLFDEPTAALDPRTQYWLIDLMVELNWAGKTIVLATHDLDTLDRLADRCIVLSEEHEIVREGPPAAVLADHELPVSVNLAHEHTHSHAGLVHGHTHGRGHHS